MEIRYRFSVPDFLFPKVNNKEPFPSHSKFKERFLLTHYFVIKCQVISPKLQFSEA